jgi:hypothetical protein
LQPLSSAFNEDGEPIMSGDAFRYEQQLDMQAQDEWDAEYGDEY